MSPDPFVIVWNDLPDGIKRRRLKRQSATP